MVVRTIEMLLEYISIILCIHRIAREKVKIDYWMIIIFLLEWGSLYADNVFITQIGQIVIYICLLVYTKKVVVYDWHIALKVYGAMVLIIIALQLIGLFLIVQFYTNKEYYGLLINITICLGVFFWKEKYGISFISLLKKIKGIYIVILLYVINMIRIFYFCYKNGHIEFKESILFLIQTIILSILIFIWVFQEKEKQEKIKELRMYELYNKAFDEVIKTIRSRQHELKNQINAIKCMKYMVEDEKLLLLKQEEYCDYLLRNNEISDLLNLKAEPALVGFLYSKFLEAQQKQIVIKYTVAPMKICERVQCYDLIEIIGILFDNAVEALEYSKHKKIVFKLIEIEKGIMLEIANVSRIYSNHEIEDFCRYGFSTKGKDRGIGLARVKTVIKRADATLLVQNKLYEEENYISFIITFVEK